MKKILITAPVHQNIKVFKEYLWSLDRLKIPEGYEVHKYFYLHDAGNLKKFLQINEYEIFNNNNTTEKNFNAIAQMRTMALAKAKKENYDYIFSVDSDIILHENTLIDLISKDKDIISKVCWTTWDEKQPYITLPNFYEDINESKSFIFSKQINYYKIIDTYSVGVVSSPLLISSKIFNDPSINYYPISILSTSYLSEYAFCVRCKCLFPNIKFYVDTVHPAKHLHQEKDYENWIKWEKKQWK